MSQDRESSEFGDMFALLVVIGVVLFVLTYFAMLALSAVMTLWALCAWYRPRTIWGHTLTPREARLIIYRGLAGTVALPVFVSLMALWFGFRVESWCWLYIVLGGYGLGSVGLGILEEKVRAAAPPAVYIEPPPPVPEMLPVRRTEPEAQRAFTFASWDDEEAGQ